MLRSPVLPLVAACLAALALAAPAGAATTFNVDSTTDVADASAGDGNCQTIGNVCTLRAAVAEANAQAGNGPFTINFTGVSGQTISTSGNLSAAISKQFVLNGCSGLPASTTPCAGINSTTATPILSFTGDTTVDGLSISSSNAASEGLFGTGPGKLTVTRTWLGITIGGASGPLGTGVRLRGNNSLVGGTTALERNVIAADTIGVLVDGADDVAVRGNYFGVNAVGGTGGVTGNGTNITLTRNGANVPDRTVIGGTLDATALGTANCDGACNLISRATTQGIDLEGATGAAGQTTIAGNYVGTTLDGTGALANAGIAIDVGDATPVTVGGPADGDSTVLAGDVGAFFGVVSGNGNGALTVRNNFLGLNAAGTAALPFVNNAAVMRGTGSNIVLRDNRVAHSASTGSAVELAGIGVQMTGNTIGIGTGGENLPMGGAIRVTGNNNLISGNTVGNVNLTGGLNVDAGDNNTITGNRFGVDGNGTARPVQNGVIVRTFNADGAIGNVIGGDTAAEENVISNATKDGVVIIGAGTGNSVLRNRGTGNAEQFIDVGGTGLTGNGPGNAGGDNGNALPPVFTGTPTTLSASGTAAANATVRVFATSAANGAEPGAITSYIGKATANGSGNWSLTYDAPLANGTTITAGSTQSGGSSGELTKATTVTDATPPETTIDDGPSGATADSTPTWAFSSEAGATFECRVDGGAFSACSSPFTADVLADGQHVFEVRARDNSPAQNADPTPATRTVVIDATAPDSAFTSGPAGLTADPSPSFGLTSDDPGATLECRVDGGAFAACSASYAPGTLGDGPHTVEVRGTDALGNVEGSPAARSFVVDTTAPDTSIASGPAGPTRDNTPSFSFASPDAGATLECRIDGAAFAPCAAAFTAAKLADGAHTVQVRGRDAAGNADASPASRAFVVDTAGPVVTIGAGKLRATKKGALAITVSCSASERTGPCAGTLTLKSAGKLRIGTKRVAVTLGTAKVSVARGAKRTVTITLSKANRALLAKLKSIKAAATLPAKDGLGNGRTATAKPTLLPPRP